MTASNLATDQASATDLDLPDGNSGSGSQTGYRVQARYNYHEPKQFGDIILDKRWKTLHFQKSPIGVPTHREFEWHLAASHCMSFEAAQALRWWFLALCHNSDFGGGLCVETRIVSFKIEYSHKSTAHAVLEEEKDAWRKRSL